MRKIENFSLHVLHIYMYLLYAVYDVIAALSYFFNTVNVALALVPQEALPLLHFTPDS